MPEVHADYSPEEDAEYENNINSKTLTKNSEPGDPMHFSWSQTSPRLVITAEDTEFDPTTIQHWREEGFDVHYLPYDGNPKGFRSQLQQLAEPLELGDKWALIGT